MLNILKGKKNVFSLGKESNIHKNVFWFLVNKYLYDESFAILEFKKGKRGHV